MAASAASCFRLLARYGITSEYPECAVGSTAVSGGPDQVSTPWNPGAFGCALAVWDMATVEPSTTSAPRAMRESRIIRTPSLKAGPTARGPGTAPPASTGGHPSTRSREPLVGAFAGLVKDCTGRRRTALPRSGPAFTWSTCVAVNVAVRTSAVPPPAMTLVTQRSWMVDPARAVGFNSPSIAMVP